MHACMPACMHACTHACMHACEHACMYANVFACMCVGMRVCMHACMYACRQAGIHACMPARPPACMHVCMRMYMHAHVMLHTRAQKNTSGMREDPPILLPSSFHHPSNILLSVLRSVFVKNTSIICAASFRPPLQGSSCDTLRTPQDKKLRSWNHLPFMPSQA